ncbi:MAG: NIPSNAP family protein [Gammaproteobacteria bacterium]|nr:NIPSNAP family protein [Gammaproteobacteria bacterium]
MIADVRTYTLIPRKLNPYLKLVEEFALPVMRAHGMVLDRYFIAKIGPLNQVVHIWNYESLAELERIRAARDADPKWAEYLSKTEGMVLSQENKIMEDASFSMSDEAIRARNANAST